MQFDKGVRLGPYTIVSLLGAGGMGEVYEAHDTRLGRGVGLIRFSGSGWKTRANAAVVDLSAAPGLTRGASTYLKSCEGTRG